MDSTFDMCCGQCFCWVSIIIGAICCAVWYWHDQAKAADREVEAFKRREAKRAAKFEQRMEQRRKHEEAMDRSLAEDFKQLKDVAEPAVVQHITVVRCENCGNLSDEPVSKIRPTTKCKCGVEYHIIDRNLVEK